MKSRETSTSEVFQLYTKLEQVVRERRKTSQAASDEIPDDHKPQ